MSKLPVILVLPSIKRVFEDGCILAISSSTYALFTASEFSVGFGKLYIFFIIHVDISYIYCTSVIGIQNIMIKINLN